MTSDKGIVDFILLYAFDRATAIADNDVRKVLLRVYPQHALQSAGYDELAAAVKQAFPRDISDCKRFYLLISHLVHQHCADKHPACRTCPLLDMCASAGEY